MTPELKVGMRIRVKSNQTEGKIIAHQSADIVKVRMESGFIHGYQADDIEPVLPTFELGDRVKAFGVEGVVAAVHPEDTEPVVVQFPIMNREESFDVNGKYMRWHAEPSLTLVEKWKPMKEEMNGNITKDNYRQVFQDMDGFMHKFYGKRIKVTVEEIR